MGAGLSETTKAPTRRQQWGAEKRSEPLSVVPQRPSSIKLLWGRIAIVTTIIAWLLYMLTVVLRQIIEGPGNSWSFQLQTWSYALTVTFLTFSATMFLIARQAAMVRFGEHRRVERALIDSHFSDYDERVTVLIPSYDEEPEVVRLTLWSAALQEFPSIRVVLLIDDDASRLSGEALERLERTRAIAMEIEQSLEPMREKSLELRDVWLLSMSKSPGPDDSRDAAAAYEQAAAWLEEFAALQTPVDHMGEFFSEHVVLGLASDLRLTSLALAAAADQGSAPTAERLTELYNRLVWIFTAEVTTFERKQYASLSQEPNKAMNLNSYMSLMGGRYRTDFVGTDKILTRVNDDSDADFVVPESTYLLTLDADSQLLRDYCLRLIYLLEQPENERVAVTQTPYSSFRGAPTRIERIAGATTDLQYIQHQGMTYYDATFWVGANAVIRRAALEDIAVTETVGGFEITTYVQDRTVIEDTESSIDLGTQGWTLRNYPERLSYSATPPDFGSLVVQRRRWANGGLLILPKFFEQIRSRKGTPGRIRMTERMLRINYMASLTWASVGLLFLLFFPYDSRLLSPLVIIAALPFFIAMGSDLRFSGHRFSDIFRIYGFNLILLPVNLAGVIKSIQQSLTGNKIPFARTPKVVGRTAAPALFVALPFLIVAFSLLTAYRDFMQQNWGNAIFAAFNATMAIWAIWSYIGIRASIVDFFLGFLNWLYVPVKTPRTAATRPQIENELVNWEQILYHGDRRLSRDLKRSSDRRRRVNMLVSKVEASGRVDVDSEPAGEAKKDTMTASAAKGAEYRS